MQFKQNNAIQITPQWIEAQKPKRAIDGHKGMFGTLNVRVGSLGMGGASALCAAAALRTGVGRVQFVSDKSMVLPLMTLCPEATAQILPESCTQRIRLWRSLQIKKSAVVAGQGLDPDEKDLLREVLFLVENASELLLDAGALTVIGQYPELFAEAIEKRKETIDAPVVLTPHPGECARIIPGWDKSERIVMPAQYAVNTGVVLVLKGHHTAVFTPDGQHFVNVTGNSGLAKAGAGDVLAGIIGGFLAQKIDVVTAAVAGVYFHGLAGDIISNRAGVRAMQPTDLFDALPEAYDTCGWK